MSLCALLQLADSGFPSGAFAHSFGLETAIDQRRVGDAATLEAWLRAYLLGALAPLDGGALALTFAGCEPLVLDEIVSAAVFCDEIHAANAAIARATLLTYASIGLSSDRLASYEAAVCAGHANGIPALAAALGYEAANVTCADALQSFFSASLAALAAAAARAMPLGQRAMSAVLWNLRSDIERAALTSLAIGEPAALGAQAFEQEIDGLNHRRLDGRLFAS
ncbi:MAG TPA: urease accessory UreF family protein [Candidatus Acidoferrales bacterium]|nr:urease accessory UreF family protein [Candidatus Acidoferrales bacterium]